MCQLSPIVFALAVAGAVAIPLLAWLLAWLVREVRREETEKALHRARMTALANQQPSGPDPDAVEAGRLRLATALANQHGETR